MRKYAIRIGARGIHLINIQEATYIDLTRDQTLELTKSPAAERDATADVCWSAAMRRHKDV